MKRLSSIVAALVVLGIVAGFVIIAGSRSVEPPRPSTQARQWTAHRPISPSESRPAPTAPSPATPTAADSEPRLVWSSNTGDAARWPREDFPLVIHVDVPEVPPEVAKLAPPIDAP
jgi:hypothetical protein